jgi:Mn-dependent DtxR family transcriptional regulator
VIKIPCTTREVAESLDIPLNSASATLSQLAARSLISHQGMQWGPPAGWQSRAE